MISAEYVTNELNLKIKIFCKNVYNHHFIVIFGAHQICLVTEAARSYLQKHSNSNKMLLKFLKIKPTKLISKQGCFTNQLPILTNVYHIHKSDELFLFKSIQKSFNLFADFLLYPNSLHYDFFIQNKLHIGNVFKSLGSFLGQDIVKNWDIVYEKNITTFYQVGKQMPNFNVYTNLNIDELFTFTAICFDIEVGWWNNEARKEFITPFYGYIQCICFTKTEIIKGTYDVDNMEKYTLVYLPPWLNKASLKFDKNVTCQVFRCEVAMCEFFFNNFLLKCDFLFGYNSSQFDLPFLINRINILKCAHSWSQRTDCDSQQTTIYKELLHKNLDYYKFDSIKSTFVSLKCLKTRNKLLKCKSCSANCSMRSFFNRNESSRCCMSCGKVCNQNAKDIDDSFDVTLETQNDSSLRKELPFGIHIDLMKQQVLTRDCENLKLETICNRMFQIKIDKIKLQDCQKCRCLIEVGKQKINTNHFFKNLSAPILIVNKMSQLIVHRFESKIVELFDSSLIVDLANEEQAEHLIELHVTNSSDDNLFYITVGKTSDLSYDEQQIWSSVDRVEKTIDYCQKDAYLTFQLELTAYTFLSPLINMSKINLPLYSCFNLNGPQQAEYNYLWNMYSDFFCTPLRNFQSIKIMFFNAIQVEYEQFKITTTNESQDKSNTVTTIDKFKNVNELMEYLNKNSDYSDNVNLQFNKHIIQIKKSKNELEVLLNVVNTTNEFELGFSNEYNSGNVNCLIKNVKKTVDNID